MHYRNAAAQGRVAIACIFGHEENLVDCDPRLSKQVKHLGLRSPANGRRAPAIDRDHESTGNQVLQRGE